jgi:integrase
MSTIHERKRKDGGIAYQAQLVIIRKGLPRYREVKTFDRRNAAAAWLEKRNKELRRPGALEIEDPELKHVIDRYISESNKKLERTKAHTLKTLKTFPIAELRCSKISSAEIVELARSKLATGVQPQTVSNYLAHLAAIFAIARPAWGLPLDPQAMTDARLVTKRLGFTSKSQGRERRPSLEELDRLLSHFAAKSGTRTALLPMSKIVVFALFSTRRQDEITRIEWKDLDEEGSRVMVRDMKNPGDKIGNNVRCDLDPNALALIKSMPKLGERIFPFSTKAISTSFTRACRLLEIEDLHFHDLRHEGISRLFEMGLSIPRVASVSGHRSWQSLQRYTHLRQVGDKYADWKWATIVLA